MSQSLASCSASQWDHILSTNSCPPGIAQSGIPILDQADVCQVLVRNASSTIGLSQRAPGIWSLTTNNSIAFSSTSERLRLMFGNSLSPIMLLGSISVAGGRITQGNTVRCVNQPSHGLVSEDWIILDSVTGNWTQAFDVSATVEDDAVAQVVSVEDSNNFCYKPIGPFCDVSGLTFGNTYYVETDGSGDLTLTEPGDTSVPRIFAISSTEGILLPYRPIDPSAGGGSSTDVWIILRSDAGIVFLQSNGDLVLDRP